MGNAVEIRRLVPTPDARPDANRRRLRMGDLASGNPEAVESVVSRAFMDRGYTTSRDRQLNGIATPKASSVFRGSFPPVRDRAGYVTLMFQSRFSTTRALPPERMSREISSVIVPPASRTSWSKRLQDGKLENLRSLHPPEILSGDGLYGEQLVVHPMKCVRDGFGAHGRPKFPCREIACRNGLRSHQRAGAIVNGDENRPGPGKRSGARQNGLHAFFAARHDLADFRKLSGQRLKFLYPIGGTYENDMIDVSDSHRTLRDYARSAAVRQAAWKACRKPMRRLTPAATTIAAKSGDVLFKRELLYGHAQRLSIGSAGRLGGGNFHHRTHLLLRGCSRFGDRVLDERRDFIR